MFQFVHNPPLSITNVQKALVHQARVLTSGEDVKQKIEVLFNTEVNTIEKLYHSLYPQKLFPIYQTSAYSKKYLHKNLIFYYYHYY